MNRRSNDLGGAANPQGVSLEGRVICLLCGRPVHSIGSHLRVHGMVTRQYRDRFPGAPIVSEHVRMLRRDAARDWGWGRRWNRDQARVARALRRWAKRRGRAPTMSEARRTKALPDPSTIARLFGSYNNGLAAAGLPTRPAHGPRGPRRRRRTAR